MALRTATEAELLHRRSEADTRYEQVVFQVAREKSFLEAIQHQINGYGTQYLIPVDNLIDEMAEELGNTEPAQVLKNLRKEIKESVKTNTAANCDYSEKKRQVTAKLFITDAFQGKVEMIMAKVKKDNFGTLQEELRDAYTIVNEHGSAFSNARVAPEFLDLYLQQIKLMSTLHEIKERQKEEQREIREKMREEEDVMALSLIEQIEERYPYTFRHIDSRGVRCIINGVSSPLTEEVIRSLDTDTGIPKIITNLLASITPDIYYGHDTPFLEKALSILHENGYSDNLNVATKLLNDYDSTVYEIGVAALMSSVFDAHTMEFEKPIPRTVKNSDIYGHYKDQPVRIEVKRIEEKWPPKNNSIPPPL